MTHKEITATAPVVWEVKPTPPAPRHVIRWCDACHNYTYHNEDGCVKCDLDYQFEITVAARCPYCGREECSH